MALCDIFKNGVIGSAAMVGETFLEGTDEAAHILVATPGVLRRVIND